MVGGSVGKWSVVGRFNKTPIKHCCVLEFFLKPHQNMKKKYLCIHPSKTFDKLVVILTFLFHFLNLFWKLVSHLRM